MCVDETVAWMLFFFLSLSRHHKIASGCLLPLFHQNSMWRGCGRTVVVKKRKKDLIDNEKHILFILQVNSGKTYFPEKEAIRYGSVLRSGCPKNNLLKTHA